MRDTAWSATAPEARWKKLRRQGFMVTLCKLLRKLVQASRPRWASLLAERADWYIGASSFDLVQAPLKLSMEVIYFGAPDVGPSCEGFMRGWPVVTSIVLVAWSLARPRRRQAAQR